MKILVACTGNSCRSQMAEGILKTLMPAANIFSAGIKPEKTISSYAVAVMNEKNIDISEQYPKNIRKFKTESFDFLISFSESAENNSHFINSKNRLHFKISDPFEVEGAEEEILQEYRKTRAVIFLKLQEFVNTYETQF